MSPSSDEHGRGGISGLTQRIRTGAKRALSVTAPHTAVTEAIAEPIPIRRPLPDRYHVKEDEDGGYLSCVEASNILVRIERGFSVSASSARKYPKCTIFLDGAAQGEPFIDAAKGIYNLDHHEGCVRSFTLATCEQAMVLIRKGLDLGGERWTVYANEPDFDTVLAIWLLFNHRRLAEGDSTVRRPLMPIVRLQGVIDAHGLELMDLTSFPDNLQQATLDTINELRARELDLKAKGEWGEIDLLDFTAASLREIDELVYTPGDFEDLREVEELARVWISSQRLALACRSEAGIYEVEEQLKAVHGDRLGLVILEKDSNTTYTVRQTDPFLPTNLGDLYDRLNLLDSAVDAENRWGGSDDIGGSPRASGTALSLPEIMSICRWVYQPPTRGRRLATVGFGVIAAVALIFIAVLAGGGEVARGALASLEPSGYAASSLVLAMLGLGLGVLGKSRFPGYFGMGRPRRLGFLVALPVTVLAAFAGAAWIPLQGPDAAIRLGATRWWFGAALVVAVVGIELLLRGVLHGFLVTSFPIMLSSGRYFISVPNAAAAVVYTAAMMVCFLPPGWLAPAAGGVVAAVIWVIACSVLALVLGGVRERSGSVWAAVLLHAASAIAAWFLLPRLL